MRFPPAIVLFTWPTPNYVDPVTRGDGALVVSIVFIVLAFLVTCLRLYTRLRITCSPGIDDILIVIALVCSNHFLTKRLLTLLAGSCNCHVRGNMHCNRTIWLDSTSLGCPIALAFDCEEIEPLVSNPLFAVLLHYKTLPLMVLQAFDRGWE